METKSRRWFLDSTWQLLSVCSVSLFCLGAYPAPYIFFFYDLIVCFYFLCFDSFAFLWFVPPVPTSRNLLSLLWCISFFFFFMHRYFNHDASNIHLWNKDKSWLHVHIHLVPWPKVQPIIYSMTDRCHSHMGADLPRCANIHGWCCTV